MKRKRQICPHTSQQAFALSALEAEIVLKLVARELNCDVECREEIKNLKKKRREDGIKVINANKERGVD